MSQFVLLRHPVRGSLGCRQEVVSVDDDFLGAVLAEYEFSPAESRILTDQRGVAEPLVDDVHFAIRSGKAVTDTVFGALAHGLIEDGIEFLCWCGNDFRELPVVRTWVGFTDEIHKQLADEPSDLFLRFAPSERL